ncbi:MAG: tetratricopeptide repeat protein [Candidatus Zixiibacteriota bacterium]
MNQQNCQQCGHDVSNVARFCPQCGAPVASKATKSIQQKVVGTENQTNKRDLLILGATFLIVTVGYFIFKQPEAVPKKADIDVQTHSDIPMEDMGDMMKILKDLPTDYSSLVALGNQFMDRRNYPVAAECYKRALTIQGESLDVRVDYGACLHGMGLPHRAMEEFRKVIRANPSHAIANFNLGIVFYDLNELDSARAYWHKTLQIDPNSAAAEAARNLLKEIGG